MGFLEEMTPGISSKQRLCTNQVVTAGPMKPSLSCKSLEKENGKDRGKREVAKENSVIQRDMKKSKV